MQIESSKDKGRVGLSLAIAYFGCNGYTVSIPLNDTQDYDLIIDKNSILNRVSVKYTGRDFNGVFEVSLRSMGGSGKQYYGNFGDSSADLLFIVTGNNTLYLIPKEKITTKSNFRLNENWKDYIVKI